MSTYYRYMGEYEIQKILSNKPISYNWMRKRIALVQNKKD